VRRDTPWVKKLPSECVRQPVRYRELRQAGYPIGGDSVKSACELVEQERLKQTGICWSGKGVQALLALRSQLLSDCWHYTYHLRGLA
jgi:hypothetical protein